MDREINYSIIIPHKNIPELLKRCLNSIPRREDIQIIVVDDNSDPDKVNFDKFPGLDDLFVEVIFTKDNKGGPGYARNVGLTKAVGKWLVFADADDYFTDGFLQYLDKYKDSNYDLIYFGVQGINKKMRQQNSSSYKYSKLIKEAKYKQKLDRYKYTVYVPWGKIIKRLMVEENKIFFDETIGADDIIFSIETAYYAKNIFLDEDKIYIYEIRSDSLTSTRTLESNFDRFCVYVRRNVFLKHIAQEKFKKNIIIPLLRLIDIGNMMYFYKALEIIKKNNINLFAEFIIFFFVLPYQIIIKIRNLILDRVLTLIL